MKKKLSNYLTEQEKESLQKYKAQKIIKTVNQSTRGEYGHFQKKYRDDPVAFVHDCFYWDEDQQPAPYQAEVLANWSQYDRQALRGPRGLGKTTCMAWCVIHFALSYDGEDWKSVQTASVWRQLEKFLWPEIHKWVRKLRWDKIGRDPFDQRTELMKQSMRLRTGEAFPVASDSSDAVEGAHADYLFYGFDESKAITPDIWDSVEGAVAGADQYYKWLAISTPGDMATRFYAIHAKKFGYEDWHTRHVTIEEVIASGRRTWEWVEQRKRQWGEDSQLFHNHVLGEFKESDESALIPLSWIEQANQRWYKWKDRVEGGGAMGRVTSLGVDLGLGGEGGDKSIYATCRDETIIDSLEEWGRGGGDNATMENAGRIRGKVNSHGAPVYVDVVGIGAGVIGRLQEQKVDKAIPFNAAKKPKKGITDKTKQFTFQNNRSALWWLGRELLDPAEGNDIMLPPDDQLIGELTAPTYKVMSNAVIQVETKEDIRKRLGRSTDRADAVLQALLGHKLASNPKAKVYVIGRGYVNVDE